VGKFDDALKKARAARGKPAGNPVSSKVVEISRENIDGLRLDTEKRESSEARQQVFKGRVDPRLISLLDPTSPAGECFKILRSKLIADHLGKPRRAIMVTSAQPADGKSLVAANLALSIAQGMNEYALLVDCDLRRPTQHRNFGLHSNHGLREYLEAGTSIAPHLMKTSVGKLTLIPAGQPTASPSELLNSEKMLLLIQELKDRYKNRFIVLDTPPVLFTADTASLFSVLDGVILVVRSGQTPREPVLDVIDTVGREKILGVVFNASEEVHRDYRYYYKYYQSGKKR
jgi:protein-tyrosine kinase